MRALDRLRVDVRPGYVVQRTVVLDRVRPVSSVQYCDLVDLHSLQPVHGTVERPAVIALAAFVGSTRLIDNVVLASGPDGGL